MAGRLNRSASSEIGSNEGINHYSASEVFAYTDSNLKIKPDSTAGLFSISGNTPEQNSS